MSNSRENKTILILGVAAIVAYFLFARKSNAAEVTPTNAQPNPNAGTTVNNPVQPPSQANPFATALTALFQQKAQPTQTQVQPAPDLVGNSSNVAQASQDYKQQQAAAMTQESPPHLADQSPSTPTPAPATSTPQIASPPPTQQIGIQKLAQSQPGLYTATDYTNPNGPQTYLITQAEAAAYGAGQNIRPF